MKVNMTPNPLDVVTIHASQGDTEARQWEFELHNNGELIDTSEITEQLFFKAYKGGTEQILPENTSTPTTTPILADIQYPDGLRTDQYFTYRETPTTVSNKARIKTIKGNTLVWNQIQPNNSSRTSSGITFTCDNGKLTVSGTATATTWWLYAGLPTMLFKAGHKYLVSIGNVDDTSLNTYGWYLPLSGHRFNSSKTIITINSDVEQYLQLQVNNGYTINKIFYPQIFDLTQMGLDITDPSEFTSLFSLPYYAYNQGTLLSFMGNGIKTVGKNQLNPSDAVGLIGTVTYSNDTYTITYSSTGDRYVGMNFYRSGIPLNKLLRRKYTLSFDISGVNTAWAVGLRNASNNSFLNSAVVSLNRDGHYFLTIDFETIKQTEYYLSFVRTGNQTSALTVLISNVMLEIGETETIYEPFTSNTISLPISTYFPNGMASAKNAYNNTIVYDELTPNKATKRLEQYTFTGNETISGITNLGTYYRCYISLSIPSKGAYATRWEKNVPNVYNYTDDSSHYYVQNSQFWYFTTSSTAQAIMNELSGTKFYYDLATPTETSFTTASLVTENAEIPLSNEDGVLIGKCTEQLSENPGFIDAKIKLSDSDGTCYSNKLQLHVERSPQ